MLLLKSNLVAGCFLSVLFGGTDTLLCLSEKGWDFISPEENTALQATVLSLLFSAGCGLVYTLIGLLAAHAHGRQVTESARRRLEVVAGCMLTGAAIKLATQLQDQY